MHNIFRLDKRGDSGAEDDGDSVYRLDRRDGVGMHGIFRLDKRSAKPAVWRSARSGNAMHNIFRLDKRPAGNMHDIFRLDRR